MYTKVIKEFMFISISFITLEWKPIVKHVYNYMVSNFILLEHENVFPLKHLD